MRRQELVPARSVLSSAALVLAIGLLVAFLLPWARLPTPVRVESLGIAEPPATVAAVLTLWLMCAWWRGVPDAWSKRVLLSGGVALFTVAAFSSLTFLRTHLYGAWIGLALAIALVALPLARGSRVPSVRLAGYALATGGAATLLVLALFLPWQELCYERDGELDLSRDAASQRTAGRPHRDPWQRSWRSRSCSRTGPASPRGVDARARSGVALVVATLGFQLERHSGPTTGFRAEFGSGAIVGLVAAGILLALVLVRQSRPSIDRGRAVVRVAPMVACAAYVAVVVLPWWGVLPDGVQSALSFAPLSWLTIAGALVGVRLLRLWVARYRAPRRTPTGSFSSRLRSLRLPRSILYACAMKGSRGVARRSWGLPCPPAPRVGRETRWPRAAASARSPPHRSTVMPPNAPADARRRRA